MRTTAWLARHPLFEWHGGACSGGTCDSTVGKTADVARDDPAPRFGRLTAAAPRLRDIAAHHCVAALSGAFCGEKCQGGACSHRSQGRRWFLRLQGGELCGVLAFGGTLCAWLVRATGCAFSRSRFPVCVQDQYLVIS